MSFFRSIWGAFWCWVFGEHFAPWSPDDADDFCRRCGKDMRGEDAEFLSPWAATIRWMLLGWWMVPWLWLIYSYAEYYEFTWRGRGIKSHWHHNPTMTDMREWAEKRIDRFIKNRK